MPSGDAGEVGSVVPRGAGGAWRARAAVIATMGVAVALVATLLPISAPVAVDAQEPSRPWDVEVVADHAVSFYTPYRTTISADGRYVTAYEAGRRPGSRSALYRVDTETGERVLVNRSVGDPGLEPEVWSGSWAAMSGDGRSVAFSSAPAQLPPVPYLGSPRQWAYVTDLDTGVVTALPAPPGVPEGRAVVDVQVLDISHDGTRVLLSSDGEVYLADVAAGTARTIVGDRAAVAPGAARLSSDGGTVAAKVDETGPIEGRHSIRVYDVSGDGIEQVDRWPTEETTPGLAVSGDGSVVATAHFVSRLSTTWAVTVVDRAAGTSAQLEPDPGARGFNGTVLLSADGSTVVAGAMVRKTHANGNQYDDHDLYAYDLRSGAVERVTTPVTESLTPSLDDSQYAAVSADGRSVAFLSSDSSIVDPNDMFPKSPEAVTMVARRVGGAPPSWPDGAEVRATEVGATFVGVSWDEAADDVGVVGYQVRLDGALVAEPGTATRTALLEDLTPDQAYEVSVIAVDGTGAASPPLSAVVRTLPTSTELAAIVVRPDADGTVTLSWDPADGAVDAYRVLRTTGSSTDAVAETSSTSHRDVGVPASTELTYQVEQVRAGSARPHTVAATVSTPSIPAPELAWSSPRLPSGELITAAPVEIALTGQPHRLATATLRGTALDGSTIEVPVDLVEAEPGSGRYAATAEVPASLDTLDALVAQLDDGAGHRASATGRSLPAPVSGSITVHFETDAPLDGATLDLDSPGTWWVNRTALTGTEPIVVGAPDGDDHQLSVWRPDGVLGASAGPLVVRRGATTTIELQYRAPAALEVNVVDPDGLPLADIDVDVRAEGSINATRGTTGADGLVRSPGWDSGHVVTVTASSELVPLDDQQPVTATLEPGENALTVVARPIPEAALTGTVVDEAGPIAGAEVTLTQTASGAPIARRARTDAEGRFTIVGLEGPGRLTASRSGSYGGMDVDLGPGGADVTLSLRKARDVLDLDLRFRGAGEQEWGPRVIVDWSSAVHLGIRLEGRGVGPTGSWKDSTLGVQGAPGNTVQVCANPREAGSPPGCSEPVTLVGDGVVLPVQLWIDAAAGVVADLVDQDLAQLQGPWRATVNGPGGSATFNGTGPTLDLDVAAAGEHRIVVTQRGQSAEVTVDLPAGQRTHLDVPLQLGGYSPFRGPGNALAPVREDVVPGEVVELRAEYRTETTRVRGAVLRIGIPDGWEALPEGTTSEGVPVESTLVPGGISVPVGDIPQGGEGVVRVAVRAPDDLEVRQGRVATATMLSGSASYPIATAVLDPVLVTIEGPGTVAEPLVRLSGRAPAGATVTIVEDDHPIGIAVAGPGGRWNARVELVERPLLWEHELAAVVEGPDHTWRSAPTLVVIDPDGPVLEEVVLSQDGRSVRFDPRNGIARFPFIIVNGTISVALRYDRPDLVERAQVTLGDLSADASLVDGTHRASWPIRFGQEGAIGVETTARREATSVEDPRLGAPVDLDGVRALLPPGLRDFDPVEVEEVDEGGEVGVRVLADLPTRSSGGERPRVEISVRSSELPGFRPSAEDRAIAAALGVPIYDVQMTATDDLSSGRASFVYAPPEVLAGPSSIRPQAVVVPVRTVVNFAFTLGTGADSIKSAAGAGSKYDRLQDIYDRIDELESCGKNAELDFVKDLAGSAKRLAFGIDAFNVAFTVASLWAAPATFGLGTVALWGAGWAADKAATWKLNNQLDLIEESLDFVNRNDDCPEKRKRKRKIASPGYIYDPSGFVYEAVEANRLEGVTATALYAPAPEGPWEEWNAEWYGQTNPLTTDGEGRYAWDVPRGFWRVRYDMPGYATAFSEVLEVLPPHFDVNVGLVSTSDPRATDAVDDGGLVVAFDQHMAQGSVHAATMEVLVDGAPVEGIWAAVDGDVTPTGQPVGSRFRFEPGSPLAEDAEVTATVRAGVRDHVGRPTLEDTTFVVTIAAAPDPGDPDPGDPDPGDPGDPDPGDPDPGDPGDPDPGDPDPGDPDPGDPDPGDPGDPDPGDPDPGDPGDPDPGRPDPGDPDPGDPAGGASGGSTSASTTTAAPKVGQLPLTGSDPRPWLVAGAMLLILGALAVLVRRRSHGR